jgi:hypothetical protein
LKSGCGDPFPSFPSESCTNLFFGGKWFPSLFHLPIIPLGAVSVPGLCVIYYYLTYNSKTNKTKKEREKRKRKKKEEPKKSTGKDGGQTNSKQDKQTFKEKKKNSRFRNSRISVLVVLVLLLFVCVSYAGLEPESDSVGALLFSQYYVV